MMKSVFRRISIQQRRSFGSHSGVSSGGLSVIIDGETFTQEELGLMAVDGVRPSEAAALKKKMKNKNLPTLNDFLVNFTIVDYKGSQHRVVGLEGQSLSEAALYSGVTVLEDDSSGNARFTPSQVVRSERWVENTFGDGPMSWMPHVVIPKQWVDKIPPPLEAEKEMLELLPKMDRTPTSRLGTEIILTKDLEGLFIYVPDPPPSDQPAAKPYGL